MTTARPLPGWGCRRSDLDFGGRGAAFLSRKRGIWRCLKSKKLQAHRPHFWPIFAAAALVGFGFADYSLIAFHFARVGTVPAPLIPVFYAVAMGTAGAASLVFGRWYDRRGLVVLVPGPWSACWSRRFASSAASGLALAGTALWGVALGVHESIMAAAIADLVPGGTGPGLWPVLRDFRHRLVRRIERAGFSV